MSVAAERVAIILAVAAAAIAFVLGSILLPAPAYANDTSVGGIGGDVVPLSNTDIRMEAETVQAICYRYFAEYRVDFKFVNAGEPQTLMLGFPYLLVGPEGDGTTPVAFRAWQDGKPLPVTVGEGHDGDVSQGYYLHEATFPRGETMIQVRYLGSPTYTATTRFPELAPPHMRGDNLQAQAARHDYWLHTGANWAGTIGKAVVVYRLADDFKGWGMEVASSYGRPIEGWPWITSPETYSNPDDHTYLWKFDDLEPTEDDDIQLAFAAPFPDVPSGEGGTGTIPSAFGAMVYPDSSSDATPWSDAIAGWEVADGSPASAWSTGSAAPGGWVQVGVAGDRSVREFRILTGRNDTLTSFGENGRPKTVKVTLSDGTTDTFDLADEPSIQTFLIAGTAEWARIDVLDVYPGTKGGDTYISEISLGNEPAPRFQSFADLIGEAAPSTGSTADTEVATTTTGSAQEASDAADQEDDEWMIWAIVALAVAAALLVALVVLLVLFFRRSRVPPGDGSAPGAG